MKLRIMIEEQFLTQTRSLLVVLRLVDDRGDLAWNAPFLCCEAAPCVEAPCYSPAEQR